MGRKKKVASWFKWFWLYLWWRKQCRRLYIKLKETPDIIWAVCCKVTAIWALMKKCHLADRFCRHMAEPIMAVVGGCKPVLVACVLLWAFCNHLVRLLRDLLRMLDLPIIILHHLVIILLPWHLFTILWPSGQHLLWCHDTHFGGDWYCIQFYTLWWFILGCLILLLWFCLLVFVLFLCVRWHCNFP